MKTILRTILCALALALPARAAITTSPGTGLSFASGVPSGTNDATIALQAVLNQAGEIRLRPTNYAITGPLWLTNNTTLFAYGARFDLATNLTGTTVLNFPTNVGNVQIFGLWVNGGNTNDCFAVMRSTNTMRIGAQPYVNGTVVFRDDRFFGFDIGVNVLPLTDGITVQQLPRVKIDNCEFGTNGMGIVIASKTTFVCAEYMTVNENNFHDNSYGAWIAAGNILFENNLCDHNNIDVCVDGSNGVNPGHGQISGNSLNHPNTRYVVCTNLSVGENIVDNLFRGVSTELALVNCKGVVISGNNFEANCRVGNYLTSGGANYVVNNHSAGAFGLNTSGLRVFDWALSQDAPTTNIVTWGNFSENQNGFDDPYHWNPYATNSTVYFPTNLPPSAALTIGASFMWNSNADHTYILRSSKTNTAWVSTNFVN